MPSDTPMGQQGKATSTGNPLDWRGSGRVLVVDDDVAIRIVLTRALAKLGFTVDASGEGSEAITHFKADPAPYVLALLDFKLPGMSSRDVLSELRSLRPDLPVILTSGFDQGVASEESIGLGITGFLHKPFTIQILVDQLRSALRSS